MLAALVILVNYLSLFFFLYFLSVAAVSKTVASGLVIKLTLTETDLFSLQPK